MPEVNRRAQAPGSSLADALRLKAVRCRKRVLQTIVAAGAGHTGGDLSCLDILTVLYNAVLKVSPQTIDDPDRDRFVMSKGHSVEALYVVLAERGFFPMSDLATVCRYQSHYVGHPTRHVRGIEQNTGALGHGLAFGVGTALAARLTGRSYRTFVLVGDGELAEGSNWEASLAAAHHRLDNLVMIVDRNGLQISGKTEAVCGLEPLGDKLRAFGYAVREVDGNDHAALLDMLGSVPFEPGKPSAVVARTIKGRGVSFIEGAVPWHHRVPKPEEYARAIEELENEERRLGAEPEPPAFARLPERIPTQDLHGSVHGTTKPGRLLGDGAEARATRCRRRRRDERLSGVREAVGIRSGAAGTHHRGGHRRADPGGRRRWSRVRGAQALRGLARLLPDGTIARADQDRRGLLRPAGAPRRDQRRRQLRRARHDAPLDARHRRPARDPGRDDHRPCGQPRGP